MTIFGEELLLSGNQWHLFMLSMSYSQDIANLPVQRKWSSFFFSHPGRITPNLHQMKTFSCTNVIFLR